MNIGLILLFLNTWTHFLWTTQCSPDTPRLYRFFLQIDWVWDQKFSMFNYAKEHTFKILGSQSAWWKSTHAKGEHANSAHKSERWDSNSASQKCVCWCLSSILWHCQISVRLSYQFLLIEFHSKCNLIWSLILHLNCTISSNYKVVGPNLSLTNPLLWRNSTGKRSSAEYITGMEMGMQNIWSAISQCIHFLECSSSLGSHMSCWARAGVHQPVTLMPM